MSRGDHDYKRSKLANHWFSCVLCGLMLLAPDGYTVTTKRPASKLRMSKRPLRNLAHGMNHF